MRPGERRYKATILAAYERGDMNGEGCRWSRETVAAYADCSLRTVARATKELEAEGLLTVERGPRGSRVCNVYRVRHRNPQLRGPILRTLRSQAFRNRRAELLAQRCSKAFGTRKERHGEEGPNVADTPSSGTPFETNNGLNPNGSTATGRPENGACEKCAHLEVENTKLVEEVSGLVLTVRQQGRHIGSLNRELTKVRESSPDADLTRRTLKYWHAKLRKSEQVKIGLTGKRAERVRWAIRQGFGADDFKAMIDGLATYPYLVYGVRRASGARDSRRDDIIEALKDERSIEELIRLGRPDVRRGDQMTVDGEEAA